MSDRYLHIVSFDVSYPPNYGGVIDVFYKIKALYNKGIKIILHNFEYPGRERAPQLEAYCEKVYYYSRKCGLNSAISHLPYIVKSRRSEEMIENLLADNHPILFEGLHSCYYLDDQRLRNRMLIYRESNIEHQYYLNLFKAERSIAKKVYFLTESARLLLFQRKLKHASLMLVVSEWDTRYLESKFPDNDIRFLPSFHSNENLNIRTGSGDYVLYHGNIEVPENEAAAAFLITKVFVNSRHRLIIAGMNPPKRITDLAKKYENISVVANPDDETLFSLIRNAQVNILVTFQATGLKLKLLNTLYNGRHCLVNQAMLNGTGLESLCHIAETSDQLVMKLHELSKKPFTEKEISKRKQILEIAFSNSGNADRLIEAVFKR
ncbi:MAG: glycosyltransferase family 1 protein [Lentimicrobium sp.]|nr:glycosyltransferase family 1 protein [Lentimicrobium sp.]